jgi:hypothetical protein
MARKKTRIHADNLAQGVSQQVIHKRTTNHLSERINIHPSLVYGNVKRPGTHVKKKIAGLSGTPQTRTFHTYDRDTDEKYLITFDGHSLRVFDRDTFEEKDVEAPNGYSYLTSSENPKADFQFLTLGDYTFITNKTVEVEMGTGRSAPVAEQAIIYVLQGDYSVTYTVTIDGVEKASFTTASDKVAQTATSYILDQLHTQLQSSLSAGEFDVTATGSVLHIKRVDGQHFTITAADDLDSESIRAVKDTVQRFDNLPDRAPDGYTVKIYQSAATDNDDYYVKFAADDPSNIESEGVWVETLAPDTPLGFKAETMPHILRRESDGSFTFTTADWGTREAGDEDSVPEPSFVGRTINWMYFFQNRLSFLSGSNIITSRTSSYFSFWRKSARTALDTDPVDLAATTKDALTLRYAFPFDERLVVLSDKAQLISSGGTTYTPETASFSEASRYDVDPRMVPVVSGSSIFYAEDAGAHFSIMEMQPSQNTTDDRLVASSVTEHIPDYIPASGEFLAIPSQTLKKLFMLSNVSGGVGYDYTWLNNSEGRVLSSWGKNAYTDHEGIWAGWMDGDVLYTIADSGGLSYILADRYDYTGVYRGDPEDICLDFIQYKELEGPLTLIEEAPVTANSRAVFLKKDGSLEEGSQYLNTTTGYVTRPSTDIEGVYVGRAFDAVMQFSPPYPVRYGPRGEIIAELEKRSQLTSLVINLSDSGPLGVLVKRPHRDERTVNWSGLVLNSTDTVIDGVPVASGAFKVGLRGQAEELEITLTQSSWLPLCVTSAMWRVTVIKRL